MRSELIAGDLRLLYLAWLFAVQHDEVDDAATEPPVPAGLAELSAPLEAVVEFLEIDDDLIGGRLRRVLPPGPRGNCGTRQPPTRRNSRRR